MGGSASSLIFQRLEVPSFDLSWLAVDDVTGEAVVLVPGGGGSTKSGVGNMIQMGKVIEKGKGGFTMLNSFDTDVKGKSILCSGVAVGACMGHNVVCAFLENYCSILKVSMEEVDGSSSGGAEPQLVLSRVADFKADFSKGGSVNCACILPSGHIVTGGDDGLCRLWAVGYNKSKPTTWQVKLLNQMEGHTAPIMAVSFHPNDALVRTSPLWLVFFCRGCSPPLYCGDRLLIPWGVFVVCGPCRASSSTPTLHRFLQRRRTGRAKSGTWSVEKWCAMSLASRVFQEPGPSAARRRWNAGAAGESRKVRNCQSVCVARCRCACSHNTVPPRHLTSPLLTSPLPTQLLERRKLSLCHPERATGCNTSRRVSFTHSCRNPARPCAVHCRSFLPCPLSVPCTQVGNASV